ncbi:MAG: VWA domain-containing protein, partial [Bacilli bacterium]|nr:VWA domain-containing protein [Bacilli bacterium]
MKDKFKKLISIISIVALIFSNPATLIYAKALDSGDVIRESVETGSLVNEGDIHIKKTATATETPGRYKITFEIEGVPYQKTYPLHAVVVFDRSGSMICSNGGARQTNSNPHYTAADGIGVSCASREYYDLWGNLHREWDANLRTKEKWENAISGAQTFQSTIKANLGDSANVSLVTFSDNADTATNSFTDADFKHPLGTTNLADAITTAKNKLDSETAGVSNAKKVILVISDGNPNDTSAATRAASSAKTNSDIEIYAIGYATTTTTSNYLKNNIASPGAKHYSDANPATITAAVEDMVNDLVAAAVDPTLTDTLTPEFKIEGAEEFAGTKTFTLENITGEKQTVSFYVDIDQTKPTGYYDTNNTTDKKAGITYTDPKTGETKTLMLDESPNVYWERPQVAYTVNHYKDRIDSNNKVEPSDTGVADYSTNIPYIARTDIKGYVFDHLEDKNGNVVENVAITKNAADNVLNVIYTKKENLEYTVVYHYEDLKGEFTETINDSGNPHTATFGDTINVEEYKATGLAKKPEGAFVYNSHQLTNPTIDDETENRLDIFYTREEYPYCVNYFYDGTEDSSLKDTGTKKYGDTLTY